MGEVALRMQNTLKQNQWFYSSWLGLLTAVLLALGLFFRFANLDQKIYSHDETYTSLWISGHKQEEVRREAFDGREIDIQDLQKYQRINPERGLLNTVVSLAAGDPHHPPFYYVLVRLWAQLIGDSVAVVRSLSALISLLVFPCLYWLCLELFESRRTAWTAVALMAVSPFHVLYAQEAREYSLWTVTTLLSSAALLRAVRLQTKPGWILYAATVGLGIYTHTLFGLVAIAHGGYVAGISLKSAEPKQSRRTAVAYLLATAAGLAAFAPWAVLIMIKLRHVRATTAWVLEGDGLLSVLKLWILGFGSVFLDTSGSAFLDARYGLDSLFTYFARLLVLIPTGYAILFLYSRTSKKIWLFVLTLIGGTGLVLMLPDLILGGRRSTPRFLIPCYLGVQLAVAHLLASRIGSPGFAQRKVWQAIMAALILGGGVSIATSSQAERWWNKGTTSYENLQVARIINQASRPLLVSTPDGANLGNVIALSYRLDPKVRFLGVIEPDVLRRPNGFTEVFLYNPPERLQQVEYEESCRLEAVYLRGRLWRLAKDSDDSCRVMPSSAGP